MPKLLVDLAAGRDPGAVGSLDPDLLVIAEQHRMSGLLWTWARDQPLDRAVKGWLAMKDLSIQAHLARVRTTLEWSVQRLHEAGIDVATLKGVTAEARWFTRPGERPCSDVDLLLGPQDLPRVGQALEELQPGHPWRPYIDRLVTSGRVQAVTLRVDGLEVDLHLDPLKIGIPTLQASSIWARTVPFELADGISVRILDDTSALLQLLIHLNKDRFQRLLGLADVARVLESQRIDWELFNRLAHGEGLEVPAVRSLEVVVAELGLARPPVPPCRTGVRAQIWDLVWPARIRLRGREGRLRFRRRQNWIALLARGRARAGLLWWLREAWPPADAVRARYRHIRGPYLWKLAKGRWQASVEHRRARPSRRRGDPAPSESERRVNA